MDRRRYRIAPFDLMLVVFLALWLSFWGLLAFNHTGVGYRVVDPPRSDSDVTIWASR